MRLLWLRAGIADVRERYDNALDLVTRLEAETPLRPHEIAFKATMFLNTGNVDLARRSFVNLFKRLEHREDDESRYIRYYSKHWLATLAVQPSQAAYWSRLADEVECRPHLKRLLWLSDTNIRDRHDEEFEDWMKVNYPNRN